MWQPRRNRRKCNDDQEQHKAHRDVGDNRLKDVGHRHLRRSDPLHRHQEQSVRRQQQPELHADQVEYAEPDQIDFEPLHDRHEDRQSDEHHADLIHKNSKKNQQQHHAGQNGEGREALAENGGDEALRCAGKTQDLRERRRAQNDEHDHPGDRDCAA